MAELLFYAKDRGQYRAGDVIAVEENGAPWGQCELGGPTYTHHDYETHRTDTTVVLKPHVNLKRITSIAAIAHQDVVSRTVRKSKVDSDVGLPRHTEPVIAPFADKAVSFTHYERVVTGTRERPISEHPHGNHSFWRILKMPRIHAKKVRYLTSRAFFIDPAKCSAELAAHWADDQRTAQFLTLNISFEEFQALLSRRT